MITSNARLCHTSQIPAAVHFLFGTQVGHMQVLAGIIIRKLLVMRHFPIYPVHQVDTLLIVHGHTGGIDDILQFGNGAAALFMIVL